MKTRDMTKGAPSRLILSFAVPLMLGNIFQQLYTFVDTIIVGQKLGIHALAAMGATEWLSFLMFGFIQGITQGFSVIISRRFGEGNKDLLQQTIFNAYCASIGVAIIFTVVGQILIYPILKLLQTPQEIIDMAYLFLQILYAGVPISFAFNTLAGILRALGNSKAPLFAMIISSLGNIILDIIFVVILELGIRGAAYGTVLAQIISTIYCVMAVKKIDLAHLDKGNKKLKIQIIKEQLQLGFPMGFQNIITAMGGLVVQFIVNGFGILFIAGYTAANKLYGLLEIAASSYGYAISTYTAQNMGAGQKQRIRKGLSSALIIGVLTSLIMSGIMLAFGKPILNLFIKETEVAVDAAIQIGYHFLYILALFFPLLYCLYIIRSCIQGMGNSLLPMISSFIQVFMRVMCALVLTRAIGNTGVFWGEVLAWLGADIFLFLVFYHKYKNLTIVCK